MLHMQNNETIAAIATAKGAGAIGIVRLSGPRSLEIAQSLCGGGDYESHRVYLRDFINPETGQAFDKGLVLYMKGPHSFTGEDVVELHGHGGIFLMRELMRLVVAQGARCSLAGEFSMRAFQNGKLDLTQAESISALISARSAKEAKLAHRQLTGHLSQSMQRIKEQLIEIAAILEAWVDFPEEGLEFTTAQEMLQQLVAISSQFKKYVDSYDEGQKLKEGLCVCLCGLPNAGKSSLLNALLGRDRAIVHSIAGTTRDAIEEDLMLGEVPLRLVDTAGIRTSTDPIEKEGINRSYQSMQDADLVLFISEAKKQLEGTEEEILSKLDPQKTLFVCNKSDLLDQSSQEFQDARNRFKRVHVSAKEKRGLEEVKSWVKERFEQSVTFSDDSDVLVHLRHKEALVRSLQHIEQVINGLKEENSAELIAADMKEGLYALGEMLGGDLKEEILDAIFSKFCIGK